MTPQERAVIQAAMALVAGKSAWHADNADRLVDLECAVENLRNCNETMTKPLLEVCGHTSPTGAMKCVLFRGHDTKLFRYHQGFASNGSKRLWRVVKP